MVRHRDAENQQLLAKNRDRQTEQRTKIAFLFRDRTYLTPSTANVPPQRSKRTPRARTTRSPRARPRVARNTIYPAHKTASCLPHGILVRPTRHVGLLVHVGSQPASHFNLTRRGGGKTVWFSSPARIAGPTCRVELLARSGSRGSSKDALWRSPVHRGIQNGGGEVRKDFTSPRSDRPESHLDFLLVI